MHALKGTRWTLGTSKHSRRSLVTAIKNILVCVAAIWAYVEHCSNSRSFISTSHFLSFQAKLIATLPFPYLQIRPTEVISLPAVNLYPFIHPLSAIDLSNRANRSPPLPPTPPVSMRAQSIPFVRTNSSRLNLSPPQRSPEPDTHPIEWIVNM